MNTKIDVTDAEEIEAVAACLGDDAARLRTEHPSNEEIADNMDRAAAWLEQFTQCRPASNKAVELPGRQIVEAGWTLFGYRQGLPEAIAFSRGVRFSEGNQAASPQPLPPAARTDTRQPSNKATENAPPKISTNAEEYLRHKYGAYRGHFSWREIGEAYSQGRYDEAMAQGPHPYPLDDATIDRHLDAILRASGSALRHYTMQKSIDDMRAALRAALASNQPGGN